MGKLFCPTELHSISKLPQNELTLRRVIPFFFSSTFPWGEVACLSNTGCRNMVSTRERHFPLCLCGENLKALVVRDISVPEATKITCAHMCGGRFELWIGEGISSGQNINIIQIHSSYFYVTYQIKLSCVLLCGHVPLFKSSGQMTATSCHRPKCSLLVLRYRMEITFKNILFNDDITSR